MLELVRLLDIGSKEALLYEDLAQSTVYDRYFIKEIKKCACVPSLQLFAFYLLREYTTLYGMYVRVSGSRVTLLPGGKNRQEQM